MRLLVLATGFLVMAGTPALAQSSDEAVAGVLACEAVRGTKARLRCLEDALPALRAAHPEAVALAAGRVEAARMAAAEEAKEEFGLSPAQQKDEETRTATADYEREAFGERDLKSGDDDDEVESVNGVALEIGKNNRGKLFVILDNGQVWRQVDGDSSSPYFPKNVEGLPVRIKKGALGSYFIKIGKAKDTFRADRIK